MGEREAAIGRRVARARKRRGWGQQQLGKAVDRTPSWASKIERGDLPLDRMSVIARIAQALDVEVVELTGQPFAASAPRIGTPRWDAAIIGLDWDTTILDGRLQQRTDAMFDSGLVGEVTALLGRGLREGVTAILQAGGSIRDFESIQACNEARPQVAMMFTGQRSFKH